MKPTLLIVDDDDEIRSQLKWALAEDYEPVLAGDRPAALKAFGEHKPAAVLLDLGLPPRPADPDEGLATLADLLEQDRGVKVIIVTGQGEKTNALKAVGAGAYDFLTKPVEVEELKVILRRAFHIANLEAEFRQMQETLSRDGFEGMIGSCGRMEKVFNTIRRVATSDAPVLILGESGTGKEVAARAIHRRSPRKNGPFVAINCGAIPETLLESELFGHERGAFTGAHVQRKGRFETAEAGTLFLDEIGELPLTLQVKLLRFLQEQTIERVGGRVPITVDTRVLAATNMDLKKAMQESQFREDLYYRVAVGVLELPAQQGSFGLGEETFKEIARRLASWLRPPLSSNSKRSIMLLKMAFRLACFRAAACSCVRRNTAISLAVSCCTWANRRRQLKCNATGVMQSRQVSVGHMGENSRFEVQSRSFLRLAHSANR